MVVLLGITPIDQHNVDPYSQGGQVLFAAASDRIPSYPTKDGGPQTVVAQECGTPMV